MMKTRSPASWAATGLGILECGSIFAGARSPSEAAAARNAADLDGLAWTPYGPPETGWRIYAPRIAVEIASGCAWDSPGFANALAGWQRAHGRPPSGVMDPNTFNIMKVRWHLLRP